MNNNIKTIKISTLLGANNGKIAIKNGIAPMPLSPDVDLLNIAYMPIIRNKDNVKQLPIYTLALQREVDDYMPAEDLDNIQLELEHLLSSVALRFRVLKSEIESLDKDERRNERRLKHLPLLEKQPGSPISTLGLPSLIKRKRDEMSLVRKPKTASSFTIKHTKHSKCSPLAPNTDDSLDYVQPMLSLSGLHHIPGRDHHMQKLSMPKNDTPNKFWLSVEPYCMPITNEDLRMLDDLMDQYSGPLIPPIPELGLHFSTVWANEDLKQIQQSSSGNGNVHRFKQNNESSDILKKAENFMDTRVTGPLTQRLVSALVEENLIQNPADLTSAAIAESSNSSSENAHSSHLNFRSLGMLRNCIGIEKRLKKELIEQGILDISDFPNEDEDEILIEIKRLTAELSTIAEHNSAALKHLHDAAKQEIKRLEIKRKLDFVDQEILETYKRTMQNKVKRRALSPEEQQEIFRLTAEQKALSDQLERMQAGYLYE